MNIVVPVKILADDQDIVVAADGSLDFAKAHQIISTYDKNALEAATQLAAANEGSTVKAISVGSAKANDSKTKKDVLARGIDELYMTAGDATADLDARATAVELAKLVAKAGGADLIVCGEGSADLYARQTGAQLASELGMPYASAVISMETVGAGLSAKRLLESELESVEIPLPAVVSVVPDIALPRICGMKDILAAGKKPQDVAEAKGAPQAAVQVVDTKAPEQAERKLQVADAADDGAIEQFAAALRAAL